MLLKYRRRAMRSNFTINSRLYRLCLAFACRDEHYFFRSHYRADAHCYGIVRHGNISKILRICSYRAIGKLDFECLVSELISWLIEADVAVSADSEKLDIYSAGVLYSLRIACALGNGFNVSVKEIDIFGLYICLLYTSPSPRD